MSPSLLYKSLPSIYILPRHSVSRYSAPITRPTWSTVFLTVALTVVLFHVTVQSLDASRRVQRAFVWTNAPTPPLACQDGDPTCFDTLEIVLEDKDDQQLLEVDEIARIVARTKGFFGRDWSLSLGWNNVRYLVEAALLQAELLNRTLVIPSFIYARSCEWQNESCAAFATMVNRKDTTPFTWPPLAADETMGWRIPISMMIDLPRLRSRHNVILVDEYLRYIGLDGVKERVDGTWDRWRYLGPNMTLHAIPNDQYDPTSILRVDDRSFLESKTYRPIPVLHDVQNSTEFEFVNATLSAVLEAEQPEYPVLDWPRVVEELRDLVEDPDDVDQVEALLARNGWVVLHTFAASYYELFKSVTEPVRQVASLSRLQGWVDDYRDINSTVLIIEGEIHNGRKPGFMRFTSPQARDKFADLALHGLTPIQRVRDLADTLHWRMVEKVGGRMWVGAHMRRGDFAAYSWLPLTTEEQIQHIKSHLNGGKEVLRDLQERADFRIYDVPNVVLNENLMVLDPPEKNDPFFIATNERSAKTSKYIRQTGGIMIDDLLTIDDRRQFGWGIMLTDILGLVEQSLLSRAYFLYVSELSSLAGGAVNMRAARGMDPRTGVHRDDHDVDDS